MDIKPYPDGEPLPVARQLYKRGVLSRYPVQVKRDDLQTDKGVDIVYHLRGVTPAVFEEISDVLLVAAFEEADRYADQKYKFAKFTVDLNLNAKGRTAGVSTTRDYIAAKNPDAETMVWGPGYALPEGVPSQFLVDKAKDVIDIPHSDSPGPYLRRKTPYKVRALTIGIREGWTIHRRELVEKMRTDLTEGETEKIAGAELEEYKNKEQPNERRPNQSQS